MQYLKFIVPLALCLCLSMALFVPASAAPSVGTDFAVSLAEPRIWVAYHNIGLNNDSSVLYFFESSIDGLEIIIYNNQIAVLNADPTLQAFKYEFGYVQEVPLSLDSIGGENRYIVNTDIVVGDMWVEWSSNGANSFLLGVQYDQDFSGERMPVCIFGSDLSDQENNTSWFQNIYTAIRNGVSAIGRAITSFQTSVETWFSALGNNLSSWWSALFSNLQTGFQSVVDAINGSNNSSPAPSAPSGSDVVGDAIQGEQDVMDSIDGWENNFNDVFTSADAGLALLGSALAASIFIFNLALSTIPYMESLAFISLSLGIVTSLLSVSIIISHSPIVNSSRSRNGGGSKGGGRK